MIIPDSQGGSLGSRVRLLVDRYWSGSVNRAALDLGVSQPSLHRVVTDALASPRTAVIDALRLGCDVPYEWLLQGVGPGPSDADTAGRPIVAGVPRWRRVVRSIALDPSMTEEVLDLPFGVWRAVSMISEQAKVQVPASALASLTSSLESWSTAFESLRDDAEALDPASLLRVRDCIRFGFASPVTRSFRSKSAKSLVQQFYQQFGR